MKLNKKECKEIYSKYIVDGTLEQSKINPELQSDGVDCKKCIHSRIIPGTHHLSCSNIITETLVSKHGIDNNWANFPFNFDSIWIDGCSSYCDKNHIPPTNINELYVLTMLYLAIIGRRYAEYNKRTKGRSAGILTQNLDIMKEVQLYINSEDLDIEVLTDMYKQLRTIL